MAGQRTKSSIGLSRGKRLRRIGAGVGAGMLVAGLAMTPVEAATSAHLIDYGDWYGYGDQGGQGYQGGGDGGSGSTSTNGDPATSSQSRGVVVIDTQLYSGSEAAGTGVVLTSSGTVVTNYHVVEGSTTVRVTIPGTGRAYTAHVVGADKTSDIAVLQLQGASGLTTATIDNDALGVGDDVTAVGNAGGTGTLTAADGQVTALNQQITTAAEDAVAGETLTGMIETDADVVPGDSGGALMDNQGEVTGIDTAASSGSTVQGFAIPIAHAMSIVNQIESGHETAQVRIGPAGYLGVQVTTATSSSGNDSWGGSDQWGDPFGNNYGSGDPSTDGTAGAVVEGVSSGSPAAQAGLAAGDVITAIGSTTVNSVDDLTSALANHQPGDHVQVSWTDSNGQQHSTTITLAASPVN
jgi:S1-C subfamily serine protease